MKKETAKTLGEIREQARRLAWWGGEHAFFLAVILLLLAFLAAGGVFWNYALRLSGQDVAWQKAEVHFKDDAFKSVLFELDQDAQRFEKAEQASPEDIFYR